MNELKKYVDHLFKKYHHLDSSELKEEILGNLEAKVIHLISEGLNEKDAIEKAKNSITTIDHLIDGYVSVFIDQFKLQSFQIGYIYLLIAWIITIPLSIFGMGIFINYGLFFICFILGLFYIFLLYKRKEYHDNIDQLNIVSFYKAKKIAWLIWLLFILIFWSFLTAIEFGSNIWFSRPVHINGPYQLGLLIAQYSLPFLSIILPLMLNAWIRLIPQYEVRNSDE